MDKKEKKVRITNSHWMVAVERGGRSHSLSLSERRKQVPSYDYF